MKMNEKMKILDEKFYKQQFEKATTLFNNNESSEEVLNILLKLKQERYFRIEMLVLFCIQFLLNKGKQYLRLKETIKAIEQLSIIKIKFPDHKDLIIELENAITKVELEIQQQQIQTEKQQNYNLLNQASIHTYQLLHYQALQVLQKIPFNQDNQTYIQLQLINLILTNQYEKVKQIIEKVKVDYISNQDILMMMDEQHQTFIQSTLEFQKIILHQFQKNLEICHLIIKYKLLIYTLNKLNFKQMNNIVIFEETFNCVVQSAPINSILLDFQIQIMILLDQPQELIKQKIFYLCEKSPQSACGYCHLYNIYVKDQNLQAISNLAETIQQKANSYQKHKTLGLIYRDLKFFDLSLKFLIFAQELNSYDKQLSLEISMLNEKLDNPMDYQVQQQQVVEVRKIQTEQQILQLSSKYIQQYQYDIALNMLNKVQKKHSHQILQQKILIQVLAFPFVKMQEINEKLNQCEKPFFLFWKAIISFRKNKLQKFKKYKKQLEDIQFTQLFQIDENISLLDKIQKKKYENEMQQIEYIQSAILNQEDNGQSQGSQRYCQSFSIILASLIQNNKIKKVFKHFKQLNFNVNIQRFQIPDDQILSDLNKMIFEQVEQIYNIFLVQAQAYINQIKSILKQFNEFQNWKLFHQTLRKYYITIIQESKFYNQDQQHEILKRPYIFNMISRLPFFYDPYSRIALKQIIQILGVCVNQMNDFEQQQQKYIDYWLENPLPQQYYDFVIEFRRQNTL